jgi:hypothetical protein
LNHGKYRNMLSYNDRREYQRVKQAEYRKRRKQVKERAERDGAEQAIREGMENGGDGSEADLRGGL